MKAIVWALVSFMLASAAPRDVDKERALRDYLNTPSKTAALRPNADGCIAANIQPGETIEGTIAATDCDLSQLIAGAPAMFRVDAFTFNVSRNSIVTVSLRSTDFEPIGLIVDGQGGILVDPPLSSDPSLSTASVHLPPGTYTAVAIALRGAGAYRLQLSAEEPRTCSQIAWRLDEEKAAAFSNTSCRGIDLAPFQTDTTPIDLYAIDNKDRKLISITYSSDTVQGATALVSSDLDVVNGMEPALSSTLRASVAPGQYMLGVAGLSLGAYKLKAATEDLRPCASQTLNAAESASGQLDNTDCRVLDFFVPSGDDTPQDVWTFELPTRTIATLTMRSNVLDSYLTLVDRNQQILAENDDLDRQTLDSGVRISLPPGTYRALASEIDVVSGNYTLRLDTEAPRVCDTPALSSEKITGTLAAGDCRVFDIVAPSTDTGSADAYKLTVPASGVYGFDVSSAQFFATLRIYDSRGGVLFTRTASRATNLAASFELLLVPGDYTVLISGGISGAGNYELAMTRREPKQCQASSTIASDDSSTRTLDSGSECRVKDVIPFTTSNAPVDLARIMVADGTTVGLQAESESFPPLVFVLDAQGRPAAAALNTRLSTTAQVEPRLPAGSHTVGVTTVLDLSGPYRLTSDSKQVGGAND
jgi:hypothetical protein